MSNPKSSLKNPDKVLLHLIEALSDRLDERIICQRVVNTLHDTTDFSQIGILLVDDESGEQTIAASVGMDTKSMSAWIQQSTGSIETWL